MGIHIILVKVNLNEMRDAKVDGLPQQLTETLGASQLQRHWAPANWSFHFLSLLMRHLSPLSFLTRAATHPGVVYGW